MRVPPELAWVHTWTCAARAHERGGTGAETQVTGEPRTGRSGRTCSRGDPDRTDVGPALCGGVWGACALKFKKAPVAASYSTSVMGVLQLRTEKKDYCRRKILGVWTDS